MNKISRQEVKKLLTLEQVKELREWGEVVTDSGYIENRYNEDDDYEYQEVVKYNSIDGFTKTYRVEELNLEADTYECLEEEVASIIWEWMLDNMEREEMRYW